MYPLKIYKKKHNMKISKAQKKDKKDTKR